MVKLVSIQVGQPQWYEHPGREDGDGSPELWQTAFYKEPVAGAVACYETGLAGDGVADHKNHGGPDKALLGYSVDHYGYWCDLLGIPEMPYGAFGENLSLSGQTEAEVCIGDVWRLGAIELQVSQPRQPCFKLGRRWNRPQLPKEVIREGKSGWYFRVLRTGSIEAGSALELIDRPHPEWTVQRASQTLYARPFERAACAELASLPELSLSWREQLHRQS